MGGKYLIFIIDHLRRLNYYLANINLKSYLSVYLLRLHYIFISHQFLGQHFEYYMFVLIIKYQ